MNRLIPLRRPGAEVGDTHEVRAEFSAGPFDLYGRHHEVTKTEADVGVTRLSEGLHLDVRVVATVLTTCDRTLEPTELELEFGDSELLHGPNNAEVGVQDWTLDLARYAERALPNEVPMQVFSPGTEPVHPEGDDDEVDPRWRGLDGLFVSRPLATSNQEVFSWPYRRRRHRRRAETSAGPTTRSLAQSSSPAPTAASHMCRTGSAPSA